jgi:hypothetical protein
MGDGMPVGGIPSLTAGAAVPHEGFSSGVWLRRYVW